MTGKIFDDVLGNIKAGIRGENVGLSMGFNRLTEYLPGVQRGTYTLIGAESSVGKTAFVDNCYVFNPYDYVKQNPQFKLNIIYFSFEIDAQIKLTKAIARKIYLDYGELLDVNYILSRGKNRIRKEHYDMVLQQASYFYELENNLHIYDVPMTPTEMKSVLYEYSKQYGNWKGSYYFPNKGTENLYTIVVVDHVGLVKTEPGKDKKQTIDELSAALIHFRNKCKFSPVVLSQFNRSISSTDRMKLDRVVPQTSDFKDSNNTVEDANVVLALFSPNRYEIENFRGYNTKLIGNRFRSLSIIKNRDGEADKFIGLKFMGEVGHFSELPRASEMTEADYTAILNS